jgi:hypothetical protein
MSDIGKKYQSAAQVAESTAAKDLLGLSPVPPGKRVVKKTITNTNTKQEIVVEIEIQDGLEATPSNLNDATISSTGVMRVASEFNANTKERERKILKNGEELDEDLDPELRDINTRVRLSNSASCSPLSERRSSRAGASSKHGIFKNPLYNYEGGLMDKLIALLGNLVKFIERIILSLLGARDDSVDPHQNSNSNGASKAVEDEPGITEKDRDIREQRRKKREGATNPGRL